MKNIVIMAILVGTLTSGCALELKSKNLQAISDDGNEIAEPACTLPGDCDLDGVVTEAECDAALGMYLGNPVQACVDRDGNGTVSIAEVQAATNARLGMITCP